MSIVYTKAEILRMLEEDQQDMRLLYQKSYINYKGKTADTKESYSEVVSEWLCLHPDLWNSITPIRRQASYRVPSHDGEPPNGTTNRTEELIAMKIFKQKQINMLGEILDYQTPLKNVRKDGAGKIDLLAYDGTTLRLLELKTPDNTETMVRCVLEGYTYLRTVDQEKLLEDFGLPADTIVKASPLLFHGGAQHKEFAGNCPQLCALMKRLDSVPTWLQCNSGIYSIV